MSPASISLIPCLIVFGLTFASLATAARFQRSLASIARYCLHCFSLRLILICSYCCSFESLSMPPSFADFSLMLQVIIGRALRGIQVEEGKIGSTESYVIPQFFYKFPPLVYEVKMGIEW